MNALHQLLAELESHQLQVCLAPSKRHDRRDHDMIRVCLDKNPRWYSKLCYDNPSSRGVRRGGPDTRIRRQNILRVLRRLCSGQPSRSKYAPEILRIARRVA